MEPPCVNEVSLREYLEALLAEREKRVTQMERDAKEALRKAEVALEKRLDLLNEFRAQSANEQANFVRRGEFIELKERIDIASGGRAMFIASFSALLAILAIVAHFIT